MAWEYDLGGAVCACPDSWDVRAYLFKVFLDPDMKVWVTPHFLDPVKTYIFAQSPLLSLLVAYLDESLEEFVLMVSGHWGWFGDGDFRGLEARSNTLISDPILSAPFGVLMGYTIIHWLRLRPPFAPDAPWWHIVVLIAEHFALGGLWALHKRPRDSQQWLMLILAAVYPLAVWATFAANWLLGIFPPRDLGAWVHVHIAWSAAAAALIFWAWLAPIPSPQLSVTLGALLLTAALALLPWFGTRLDALLFGGGGEAQPPAPERQPLVLRVPKLKIVVPN